MAKTAIYFIVVLVQLSACSLSEWVGETFPEPVEYYAAPMSYQTRDISGWSMWTGRHVDELIASRGSPYLLLEARAKGAGYLYDTPAIAYVYASEAGVGRGCLDTYVVDASSGMIVRYHCR